MASKILHVILSCSLLFLLQFQFSAGQNVVKAAYWFSGSEYAVSDIDSSLFTHLFCAFADLNPQTNRVTISSGNQARFSTFTATVQRKNPSVKTLLSIGGGGGDAVKAAFASMASQASSRKLFIDSSIQLARNNNFHGLDIDWEYPANAQEMANFGSLLNEWRAAVAAEARSSGKPALLLSAAVSYSSNYFGVNNPVQAISNSLDWINVMAYDFFYNSNSGRITGPPAALYSPGTQISGNAGITAWIQAGLSAKKIVLGFPYFGHSLQLADANNHGFWAPTSGVVNGGATGYKQIKQFIAQNKATHVFNATVVSDYCYSGTTWIGYDDTQSISTKVNYAKGKNLLGYFAWHIANDDNWALSRLASQTWG
ncbi:class V chitinase-like [Pistacia vera]|uniref:class V chitinase-like n=1 Tax=Pistacia vera TaxID=55513 RepID=UPI001263DF34|nr:class V chitinase-like [Pistacia vera]